MKLFAVIGISALSTVYGQMNYNYYDNDMPWDNDPNLVDYDSWWANDGVNLDDKCSAYYVPEYDTCGGQVRYKPYYDLTWDDNGYPPYVPSNDGGSGGGGAGAGAGGGAGVVDNHHDDYTTTTTTTTVAYKPTVKPKYTQTSSASMLAVPGMLLAKLAFFLLE